MTTPNEAREAIHARFLANWDEVATPVVFEEEPNPEGAVDWVRVTMRSQGGGQLTHAAVGARKFRRFASVFVQVFTEIDKGRLAGDLLGQSARAIFEATSFSGLDFNDGTVKETGPDSGKWDTTLVEVLFDYQETK